VKGLKNQTYNNLIYTVVKPNYEIKRTPDVGLRSNHHYRRAPLISALAFVPALGRVLLSSGWCRSALVAEAQVRWVISVEKQSKSKAREVRKLLKSRGVGPLGNVGPVTLLMASVVEAPLGFCFRR
jgi:hypothetical protein